MTTGVLPDEWLHYYEARRDGLLATPPGHRPEALISYEMWLSIWPQPEAGQ